MSDPVNSQRGMIFGFATAPLATFVFAALAGNAWSQPAPPQPATKTVIIQVAPAPVAPAVAPLPVSPVPPVASAPPPPENPGLINEIGKLFKNQPSILPAMPSMPSFKGFGEGTDGLTRLNTIVKGRTACPVAANGAPDCKTASDRLCQSKGFKEGKSLDTDAAQTCSPKVFLPGRKREEDDCRTDNYVTQALCQ
jgi:hypothetical protein